MAKTNNKLKDVDLTSLVAYVEASQMVTDYYENLSEAHTGIYDDYSEDIRNEALKNREKYKKVSEVIFKEIKQRIDDLQLV